MGYNTGGSLAFTGTAITIGGTSVSMPTLAAFGGLVVLLGVALALAGRRSKRRASR